ncbi:MAG: plasmid pRiA4b ORF-3 family protein [Kiritimatiellae bacterium]|nr:plasmid pRiA4b ORF-3 family protein [Kiritimatiellia bacterium]
MNFVCLKIEVDETQIMRKVVVPSDYSLAFLHFLIQDILGWKDCHLHEFSTDEGCFYGARGTEPEFEVEGTTWQDEALIPINKCLKKKGDVLDYLYDFGDCNDVTITCMGQTKTPKLEHFATSGTDMIEDAMGLGGTEEMVRVLKQPKSSPLKKSIQTWLMETARISIEQACHEPSVDEIIKRVHRLVSIVDTSLCQQLQDGEPLADAYKF